MLRHHHIHGAVVPAQMDAMSGYRRYAVARLTDAAARTPSDSHRIPNMRTDVSVGRA